MTIEADAHKLENPPVAWDCIESEDPIRSSWIQSHTKSGDDRLFC
jgi:hypothetical protein